MKPIANLAIVLALSSLVRAGEPAPLLTFGKEPVTIVCLGDSVTGVYYHTGGQRAYPEMLEIGLRKLHPLANVTVINAGISGNTTQNGLDRLETDVLGKKPNLVSVSFGLNDMTRVPPERFRENLQQIVARCRAVGAQVVLCTPNAVQDTPGRPRAKLVEYCDIIRDTASSLSAPLCDQYAAGEAHRLRDGWDWRLTLSDEIHPNMDGHKRMAQELCKVIAGKDVSLADVGPPAPLLRRTRDLLAQKKTLKVLAMPPLDAWVQEALQKLAPGVQVELTPWPTEGRTLAQLEQDANQRVRKLAPNLVVIAVPREAEAGSDEEFVKSYTWILNWSLSFGHSEWDCLVVHPSVMQPEASGKQDDLIRRIIRAQHLPLLDRPDKSSVPAKTLFTEWIARETAADPKVD